jgi:hypothetical protein
MSFELTALVPVILSGADSTLGDHRQALLSGSLRTAMPPATGSEASVFKEVVQLDTAAQSARKRPDPSGCEGDPESPDHGLEEAMKAERKRQKLVDDGLWELGRKLELLQNPSVSVSRILSQNGEHGESDTAQETALAASSSVQRRCSGGCRLWTQSSWREREAYQHSKGRVYSCDADAAGQGLLTGFLPCHQTHVPMVVNGELRRGGIKEKLEINSLSFM